jgi:hypothetical protein
VTNIVALNNQTHRTLRVQPEPSARFGDNQRFVQIIVGEFPYLVMQYPILLSKSADTGAFFCGAMLGVDEGENLFLNEGSHEGQRPLNLQRMPFYVSDAADLGIDLDHPRVSQERGQALFTEEGNPTAYLESIKAAFRDLEPGMEMTKAFIDTLMRLKLVEPVDIKLGFDDGSKRELAGLYTINQPVLRALPDASVMELFRRGYLQLIYLMIASLKQVPVLARKKNDRLLQASEALASRAG